MSSQRRTALVRVCVVTLGRAACVLVVGGGALLVSQATSSPAARGWVWLGATILVAATVMASRSWVEAWADRVAYGSDGDPYSTLSGFVQRISETLAVDDVLPRVAQTVTQATHSSSSVVRLWLADGAEWQESWPKLPGPVATDVVDVPLQHHGEQVGVLGVATDGRTLTGTGRELLDRLAGTAGLALSNVRLTYDLRRRIAESRELAGGLDRSRQRLLDSAAEQTERFSLLVDGSVQSRLQSAGRVLDKAERGDHADLEEAAREATAALEALRDIASGVFPPTLRDNGLQVALEGFARRDDGRVHVAHQGDRLRPPHAVEAAAYFCAVQVIDDCVTDGGQVQVDLEQHTGSVSLTFSSHRVPSRETLQLVADRVDATDGTVQLLQHEDGERGDRIRIGWAAAPDEERSR